MYHMRGGTPFIFSVYGAQEECSCMLQVMTGKQVHHMFKTGLRPLSFQECGRYEAFYYAAQCLLHGQVSLSMSAILGHVRCRRRAVKTAKMWLSQRLLNSGEWKLGMGKGVFCCCCWQNLSYRYLKPSCLLFKCIRHTRGYLSLYWKVAVHLGRSLTK